MQGLQEEYSRLVELSTKHGASPTSSTTDETDVERRVRLFNQGSGDNPESCPECRGRGEIAYIEDGEMRVRRCSCWIRKQSMARVQRSGLGELYEAFTLDNYNTDQPWQKKLKNKAMDYLKGDGGWFFLCGRSGSGKSHLTCAIARELLEAGCEVRYLMWRQEAPRLKALVNERDEYDRVMDAYIKAKVLVIDDLFKGKVTDADINLAFELLNARYNAPSKQTIISSERQASEIMALDEAVGSRIIERARGYLLHTDDVNLRVAR